MPVGCTNNDNIIKISILLYIYIAEYKFSEIIKQSYYFRLTNEIIILLRIVVKSFGTLGINKSNIRYKIN